MKDEKFHIVPFEKGYRVMSSNGTFFSNKALTLKRARQQQKALYVAAKKGKVFLGSGFSIIHDPTGSQTVMKGSGFLGDAFARTKKAFATTGRLLTRGTKNVVEGFKNRVVDVAQGIRKDYPPKARETIFKYGDGIIEELFLRREPIQSFINKALDFVTMGKWSEAKQKYNYDKLFHLSLVASVNMPNGEMKQIIIEKNEVINISDSFSAGGKVQYMKVPVPCCVTLREFLDKGQKLGGDNYFIYDAFKSNCQMFLKTLLDANGLSTDATTAFILQPVEELLKELPSYTGKVARALTDVAGVANVAIYGRGEDTVNSIVMKPKDFFDEHIKLVDLLDTISDKLKTEANEQKKEALGMKKKLEAKKGKGQSEYSKRHIEKLREFAKLPEEEQKRIRDAAEARRATLVNPMVERNQRVAEYNAEMKRRRESPFAPIVDGLVKAGDFLVENVAEKVGVPKVVTEAYKAFAPPTSKFAGSGTDKAFIAQAKRAKMTTEEFSKEVTAHPEKYQEKTRKRAQSFLNINKGGTNGVMLEGGCECVTEPTVTHEYIERSVCGGSIHNKFKKQLEKAGFSPDEYLKKARLAAKKAGYDERALEFSDDGVHKLMIYDDEGKVSRFGRVGYGDFIIWTKVKPEIASKKRDTFHKSHSKIKGDWKNDKFSPNNLALRILWG